MKKLLLLLTLLFFMLPLSARQPMKGYRGFVDWNNDIRSQNTDIGRLTDYYTGVSTSHGYQITPWIYTGAGIVFECSKNTSTYYYILAPFADIRSDLKFGKFTPFVDIRIGYNFSDYSGMDITKDEGGLYFSPAIGYRFNWGRKMGVNLGVGLTLKGYSNNPNFIYTPDGFQFWNYDSGVFSYFSFRVGIDF